MKCPCIVVLLIVSALSGCRQETTVDKGDPATTVIPEPNFAPLPAQPILTHLEAGESVWGDAATNDSRMVKVLFDNGTDAELTIEFAADATLKIAAKSQTKVFTHVGPLAFLASDVQSTKRESIQVTAEPGDSYIYNHRAVWDYTFERRSYSTMPFGFGNDNRTLTLQGPTFFETGLIDYWFEGLPASVMTPTIGDGFATDSKTALNRSTLEDPPHPRVVRRIETGGVVYHVTTDAPDHVEVHRLGDSIQDGRLQLYVDHAAVAKDTAPMAIRFGEHALAEVPADQVVQLFVPLAMKPLLADYGGGVTASLDPMNEPPGKYVWCPNGRRYYFIEFKRYSASAIGFGTKPRESISCRGLRFFTCSVPIVFERFPTAVTLSENQFEANIGRLEKDEVADYPVLLEQSMKELHGKAKVELPADKFPAFEAAFPVNQRVSDCDLMLAEAWLALEQREFETTVSFCNDVNEFQPRRALVFKLRGLATASMAATGGAASDLRQAIALDPGLEQELRPHLDKLEPPTDYVK